MKLKNILIGLLVIGILGSFASQDEDKDKKEDDTPASVVQAVESQEDTSEPIEEAKDTNVKEEVEDQVEEVLALDLTSDNDLIENLISQVDYDTALMEYQAYYSQSDVKKIQERLKDLEINCGEVDGYAGKQTIAAVVHFQDFHKMKRTGIVDEATANKMSISYSSLDADNNKNSKEVTVSLVRSYMAYNNSVGNDWSTEINVDGQSIKYSDYTVSLKKGQSITITAKATEDDSIPDVGRASITLTYDDLIKGKSYTEELSVIVRENRGRYSGNTAEWVFEIDIKV